MSKALRNGQGSAKEQRSTLQFGQREGQEVDGAAGSWETGAKVVSAERAPMCIRLGGLGENWHR